MSVAALALAAALLHPAAPPSSSSSADSAATAHASTAPPVASTPGPGAMDDARRIAESYLKSLEGKGGDEARNFLLGGVTLTAQDFTIPNWKIKSRDAARVEDKDLVGAIKMLRELERKGAEALNNVVVAEDSSMQLSQEQANKLLAPTKAVADKFRAAYPVFAYVARVDKDVFWHPENPWLKELKKMGSDGSYHLEVHRFMIEESEDGAPSRMWPLRVLRVKTSKGYDSGWKILPASDWDPNY